MWADGEPVERRVRVLVGEGMIGSKIPEDREGLSMLTSAGSTKGDFGDEVEVGPVFLKGLRGPSLPLHPP